VGGDPKLMTDLRRLLDEVADGPAPPTRLVADEMYDAGRRRHRRRRRALVGGVAAVTLAAVAALGTTTAVLTDGPRRGGPPADRGASVQGEPRPGVSGTGAIIQWAGAADAGHVYLAYLHCPGSPCRKDSFDLVGTADGGHTWSPRSTLAATGWQILGPEALFVTTDGSTVRHLVTVDGGRSWSELKRGPALPGIPRDAAVTCVPADRQGSCTLFAVEPVAGRFGPLATQPSLMLDETSSIVDVGGRLWVTGHDRATGRPAVAVSADRGHTWSPKVFAELATCTAQRCDAPELATAGGRTAYLTVTDRAHAERVVYRTDGGGGWTRLDTAGIPSGRAAGWSFVAADGSHVICELGGRGAGVDRCQFWAATGMAGYRQVELAGLLSTVDQVRRTPDGWYYAVSYAGTSTLYGSRDGWRWSPVTPR
jgi:hypothetical protein